MKKTAVSLLLPLFLAPALSSAQNKVDPFPKDNRSYAEKEQERNEREVRKEYERQQQDKKREEMRDKSHDNRYNLDKNTSVAPGRTSDGKGVEVNVRKTY